MTRKVVPFRLIVFFLLILAQFSLYIPANAATSTGTPSFTDIKGHWAESQITRLATLGMVKGYEDHTYKPDQPVSQLESLVFILQSAGYTPVAGSKSVSAAKSSQSANTGPRVPWGQAYLDLAIQKGFIENPVNKVFNYDGSASRLDIARLLGRVLLIVPPLNSSAFNTNTLRNPNLSALKDITTVPAADQPLIRSLADAGIIAGYPDGLFHPYQTVTRAELATIISHSIDLGWIKTGQGRRQAGWISRVTLSPKIQELEITSLSGQKKYKLSSSAHCFKNGVELPLSQARDYRCEVILDSKKQADWINLLEPKEPASNPVKLRGSVKSIMLGDDNMLVVNDLQCIDHTLPIAWDAVLLNAKNSIADFKTLKVGSFVDLEISQSQVKKVTVLNVKTLSDTVKSIEGGRLYLKSGTNSQSKPGWFNHWDFARIIDKNKNSLYVVNVGNKVQITYLDPNPKEIDDEIPLEIMVK